MCHKVITNPIFRGFFHVWDALLLMCACPHWWLNVAATVQTAIGAFMVALFPLLPDTVDPNTDTRISSFRVFTCSKQDRAPSPLQQNLLSNSCLKTADCSSYFGTKTTLQARSVKIESARVIKRNPLPQTGFSIWSKQHRRKERASCLVHHKQDWNICWPNRFKTIVLCYFHDSRQEIW